MNGEWLRLERRDAASAVLWIDDPQGAVNTLRPELAEALQGALAALAAEAELRVLVIASAKPDGFIAGADLGVLQRTESAAQATELSRLAQEIHAELEALPQRVVAAIHGPCLGGGLELALACSARVASDAALTRLGLPEVQLGLLPGGGGTQRLPRLVGVERALDMMLTGRQLGANDARRCGLVDEVVPRELLIDAALKLGHAPPAAPRRRWRERLLAGTWLGRALVFGLAERRARVRTQGHYPAPQRILEAARTGLARGPEAGLRSEAEGFGDLVVSPVSRELVGLFFASTALKRDPGVEAADAAPRAATRVGVIGAGLMGAGIAAVSAHKAGLQVRLRDRDELAVGRALAQVHAGLQQRVRRRRLEALERDRVMARLSGTVDYSGFDHAEVVIEAVFEDLPLKHRVLAEVEALGVEDQIFASNTSSLPIADIAAAARHPERVIGMHYFSPVERMPLLEVVVTRSTAAWVVATCVALGKRQGKTVIVVNDGPGFYTSRVLAPYLLEALHLVADGVAIERVDAALTAFGFPVGPLTLLDEVGLDVGAKVVGVVAAAFGDRLCPPAGMDTMLAEGRLGRKRGRGFYRYDGRRKRADASVHALLGRGRPRGIEPADMVDRCVLMLVNEAVRCLDEGVLRSARDGDVGAVFGLGFPPYLGGPFRYLEALGAREVVARLERLAAAFGPRFEPCLGLRERARAG